MHIENNDIFIALSTLMLQPVAEVYNIFCEMVGLVREILQKQPKTHSTLWLYESGSQLLVRRSQPSYFSEIGGPWPPSGTYTINALRFVASAALFRPSTLPGEIKALHLLGFTPDYGRDADWLSGQLRNKNNDILLQDNDILWKVFNINLY